MMKADILLLVKDLTYLDNGPYSFKVRDHEIVGLTGASGIGKTQMLRALVEVISHGGEIHLRGVSSSGFSAPDWRKKVALVPATSVWWRDTVGEHFPGNNQSLSHISWIERLGFAEDVLTWRVSRLSTGEQQRLGLARALVNEPSVLLLDEPCSALDAQTSLKVEEILIQYACRKQTALLWVSHDLEQLHRVATNCYRVGRHGLEVQVTIAT